jgi:NarL family two-component system response regulator LiaR
VIYSSSVDLAPEVRREGVFAYVVKEEMESHLLVAIRAAVTGKWYASPIVQAYLDQSTSLRREFNITPREWTTLKLLAQGKSTEEIAEEMGVGPRTAQNNISQLYGKTNCTERTQLAEWYRTHYYEK